MATSTDAPRPNGNLAAKVLPDERNLVRRAGLGLVVTSTVAVKQGGVFCNVAPADNMIVLQTAI